MKSSQSYYDAKTKVYWYVPFGKHEGELIPRLILTHPHYIHWCIQEMTSGLGLELVKSMKHFMGVFDKIPFRYHCDNRLGCGGMAEYVAVKKQKELSKPIYLCERCKSIATDHVLIATYQQALDYVYETYGDNIVEFSRAITYLCRGKGLHGKRTDEQIMRFFGLVDFEKSSTGFRHKGGRHSRKKAKTISSRY